MMAVEHLEGALARMQRIITLASQSRAPITRVEALEHLIEEMELAGFGSTEPPAAAEGRPFTSR